MADDRVRIIFDEDGYPRELIGAADRERAIRTGSLTPDTSVTLYRAGAKPVAMKARHVDELRALFGDLPPEPLPVPPPPPPAAEDDRPAEPDRPEARPSPPLPAEPSAPVAAPERAPPLQRGANVSLSRAAPGLRNLIVGVGWDKAAVRSRGLELDVMAFILTPSGKVRSDADLVFYNNLTGASGAVRLSADPSQQPWGDIQAVSIELDSLGAGVSKLSFAVSIYEGEKRGQNFGMVDGAYIRVINADNGLELARCEISPEGRTETAMVFGEIYDRAGEWKFKAVDQGYSGGLGALAQSFGVDADG